MLIRKLKLGKYSPRVMQCWKKTAGKMFNKFSSWRIPRFGLMPQPNKFSTGAISAPSENFYQETQTSYNSTIHPISVEVL